MEDKTMPVSVSNSKLIYDALKACNVKIMSALPETWLVHLVRMADEDPDVTLVRLAKEEEGIGISAGAHLAGINSALLMQNHGFLADTGGYGHRTYTARLEHSHLAPDQPRRCLPAAQRRTDSGKRLVAPGCCAAVTRIDVGGLTMLRADALQVIYPELEHRIVVTIMGAVAAELYMLGHRHNFFYL